MGIDRLFSDRKVLYDDCRKKRMEIPTLRTWIIFYLLSFVVLLFALFLSVQGVLLSVSLILVIILIGVNLYTLFKELNRYTYKAKRLKEITQVENPEYRLDQKKLW